ncbi:MAG: hypothetical protein H6702_25475 [Myxococcales bacterium]|nr:hypothetical protein [Myxococcales bacterium]
MGKPKIKRPATGGDPPAGSQQFSGTFDPPALGADRSPVRVAGPGTLTLGEAELVASAFEPKGSGLRALGFIAAIAATAGLLTWIRVTFLPESSMVVVGAVAGVVGIGLYRLLMRGAVYDRARPQTRRFPMTGLTDARADLRDGDSLVLRIEYDTFRGTLHFKPDGGPDALRAALQRRGVRVRAR